MLEYKYAYLVGTLFLAPVWGALFWFRKDLRREMLVTSFFAGFLGPLTEWMFLQDYWNPETITGLPISVEDYLFVFFIVGIASVIYEEVFGKRHSGGREPKNPIRFAHTLVPVAAMFLLVFNGLFFIFGINSIYASIIGYGVIIWIMLKTRRDLFESSVVSGILVGGVMFGLYMVFLTIFPEAIRRFWRLENISGILVVGIPIEELIWAFGCGAVVGPMYEFLAGLKLRSKIAR